MSPVLNLMLNFHKRVYFMQKVKVTTFLFFTERKIPCNCSLFCKILQHLKRTLPSNIAALKSVPSDQSLTYNWIFLFTQSYNPTRKIILYSSLTLFVANYLCFRPFDVPWTLGAFPTQLTDIFVGTLTIRQESKTKLLSKLQF